MDSIELVRQRFAKDIFATETTGVEILDSKPYYSRCAMKIGDRHRNAMGTVMGGAIFTLADFAFAVAANAESLQTVSASSSITYLSSGRGDSLFAEARCLKDGRTTCFFEVTVSDESGKAVAKVSTMGVKIPKDNHEKQKE